MADFNQTTRLVVGRDLAQGSQDQRVLRAVQQAVTGHYEILGELGRGGNKVVYLARELATRALVALQLTPGRAGDGSEFWLDVLRRLDASLPGLESKCPRCAREVRGWARFCGYCGADLSGVAASNKAEGAKELLAAVQAAARGRYEILGEMSRAEGGGVVYFARETATNRIVALRLQRESTVPAGADQYGIQETMILNPLVNDMIKDKGPKTETPQDTLTPAPGPVHKKGAPPATPTPSPTAGADVSHAQPSPAPPMPAPPSPATRSPRVPGPRATIALAAAGAALVAGLGVWALTRPKGDPDPTPAVTSAAAATPAENDVPAPELVEVELGGRLPPNATVWVDDARVTDRIVMLAPGTHQLRVTAPGRVAWERSFGVTAGKPVVVPLPARLPGTEGARRESPRPPALVRPPSARPATTTPPAPAPAAAKQRIDTVAQSRAVTNAPLPSTPPAIAAVSCATLFANLDWGRALSACREEATQGSVVAQRTLGTIFERGLGTGTNPERAAQLYRQAADAGDAIAQFRLGVLLRDGRGVRRNEDKSAAWFKRSATQGLPDAQLALGRAYERGEGVRKDKKIAVQWYRQAAEQGSAEAQFRLGQMYARGEGVPKSEQEAMSWFRLAAAQGHAGASAEMRRRRAAY